MVSRMNERRLSSFGDYLCLRDAASEITNRLKDSWRAADSDAADTAFQADRRAAKANAVLFDLLLGGKLSASSLDDEGAVTPISRNRLSKPYFDIDVPRSQFRWTPDDWAPIFVSKSGLRDCLAKISGIKPRKEITHNWGMVASSAWKLALENSDLREPSRLIDAVQQFWIDKRDKCPDGKELRDLANEIIEFLGDRSLSRDVSSAETSSDTLSDSV